MIKIKMISKHNTKEPWNIRNNICYIYYQNTALRLSFCVPNVVYLYDLQMSIVNPLMHNDPKWLNTL